MQPGPIALGWIVAAALLIAEHVAMWDQPWRLETPWNYLIGVLTLAVGWAVWGLTASGPVSPIDAVANIGAVTSAGITIIACYWLRARWDRQQKQNATVEQAKRLTQDLIDNGGRQDARQPNLYDPSRKN